MHVFKVTFQPVESELPLIQDKLTNILDWTHVCNYYITHHHFNLYIKQVIKIVTFFLPKNNNVNN